MPIVYKICELRVYGGARPENFPTVNDYRNPLVAEAMKVMKYVNKFNRGVAKVQEMLKENGNPPAKFDVDTLTAFRVVVNATVEDTSKVNNDKNFGVNGDVNVGVNGGINGGINDLSPKLKKVYEAIKNNANITYNQLSAELEFPESSIEKNIKKLKELNLIKREGSRKTGKWIILK